MGIFSIWHWLIVIFFFYLLVAAVASIKKEKPFGRRYLLLWTIGLVMLSIALRELVVFFPGIWVKLIAIVSLWTYLFLYYQRIALRSIDAGHGKTIAYLAVIPAVNLICLLALLILPTQSSKK